jgi:hypothetical protein
VGPERSQWLLEKLPCPCNACKMAISRLRRVCLEHVEKQGLWEDPRKRARQAGVTGKDLASIDVTPDWRVMGGRMRKHERLRQRAVTEEEGRSSGAMGGPSSFYEGHTSDPIALPRPHMDVEEDRLEDMVEDLLAREDDGCEDECDCDEVLQSTEDMLLLGARTPLFEGAEYSKLRASLEILNLQAMFGWSNSSVDALLK